jgi:Flp pilus assembly secretin CpaC
MDIPLLGNLFTSRSDSKDRSETIVMIRPTVLKTPEIAAAQAVKEEQRLPGISAAAAEDAAYERKLVENQQKLEQRQRKLTGQNTGFDTTPSLDSSKLQKQDDGLFYNSPATTPPNTNGIALPTP